MKIWNAVIDSACCRLRCERERIAITFQRHICRICFYFYDYCFLLFYYYYFLCLLWSFLVVFLVYVGLLCFCIAASSSSARSMHRNPSDMWCDLMWWKSHKISVQKEWMRRPNSRIREIENKTETCKFDFIDFHSFHVQLSILCIIVKNNGIQIVCFEHATCAMYDECIRVQHLSNYASAERQKWSKTTNEMSIYMWFCPA